MVHLKQPQLSGHWHGTRPPRLTSYIRLAAHEAGRHGLAMRRGQLPDAVVEALLTHGGSELAVLLYRNRVSPAMHIRIAEHPDPAIRDAHADFTRSMAEHGVPMSIENLVEAYGRPPAELAADSDPKLRAMVAHAWRERPITVQLQARTSLRPGGRWLHECLASPGGDQDARLHRRLRSRTRPPPPVPHNPATPGAA